MTTTVPGKTLRTLLRDRRGVAALYITVALASMVLFVLAGLDLLRVHLVRSRVWAAADAALLAAGNALGEADWQQVGVDFFNANMGQSYMGTSVTVSKNDFISTPTGGGSQTVSLSVEASVPLLSTGFLSLTSLDISTSSKALRQSRAAEVALVLDNTGSMGGTKIAAMRSAATTLVNTLIGPESGGTSVIGLVPFNETVRVNKVNWLEGSSPSPLSTGQWDGCMFERQNSGGAFTLDTTTPGTQRFTAYTETKCRNETQGHQTVWTCQKVVANNQNGCVSAPVQFLNGNATDLKNAIGAMNASGSTMVAGGLVWGWRMLDPAWRGTDAQSWGSATLPKNVNPDLQKVIVLLTDGDNEVTGGSKSNDDYYHFRSPFGDASHVTYINPDTGTKVSSVNLTGTRDGDANAQLTQLCNAVKNSPLGIVVYTITFGNGISATTKALMSGCASSPSYYYDAPTSDDLEAAFTSISGHLSELRLIQ